MAARSTREVVTDPDADLTMRVKCATEIMNRVWGMPAQAVAVDLTSGGKPWEEVMAQAIVNLDAIRQAPDGATKVLDVAMRLFGPRATLRGFAEGRREHHGALHFSTA